MTTPPHGGSSGIGSAAHKTPTSASTAVPSRAAASRLS